MFKKSSKAALLAAAGLSALVSAPAFAQEEVAATDEVIVTLQKREQAIQDVPAALTAVSGEFLADNGLQEFDELSRFVPGFEVQNQSPNNPGFVIRGIASDSLEATNEPRISVFQDGVSISRAVGSYVELFDVERVEIAKGPQSTLFGRGALIGAVNVIQNKADLSDFDWAARGEVGNLDYRLLEAWRTCRSARPSPFACRAAGRSGRATSRTCSAARTSTARIRPRPGSRSAGVRPTRSAPTCW